MSNTILLTGATGFVGRQVLRSLVASGTSVRVVVRGDSESRLPDLPIEAIVTSADIFNESAAWWATACEGIDTVVHVAWYAEPGKYLQSSLNLNCLSGTIQLAQGVAQAKVRRFVGVGTCFEYELSSEPLAIDAPLRPLTPYAGAKAAAFMALQHSLPAQSIEFAWCRLFYLYGEGEDERRLVPYLHSRLAAGQVAELTSGTQVRDFLDVKVAGQMIADIALGYRCGAANICSAVPITIRQMAEQVADEYGRRDLLKFGARPDNITDPAFVVGVS